MDFSAQESAAKFHVDIICDDHMASMQNRLFRDFMTSASGFPSMSSVARTCLIFVEALQVQICTFLSHPHVQSIRVAMPSARGLSLPSPEDPFVSVPVPGSDGCCFASIR